MRRLSGGAATAAVLVCVMSGCTDQVPGTGTTGSGRTEGGGAALAAAESLTVKGRAPRTGYDRDRFGRAWADTDSNDCGTRVISMLRAVAGLFSQRMEGVVGCAW